MADQDEQTYVEWLKANPAPSFAALIARHGSYDAIPPLKGGGTRRCELNGNAVGGRAPPRRDRRISEATMLKPRTRRPEARPSSGRAKRSSHKLTIMERVFECSRRCRKSRRPTHVPAPSKGRFLASRLPMRWAFR